MDLSTFYGLVVNKTSLGDANQNNGMRDAANEAWSNLSQYAIIFFILMIMFAVVMTLYYYKGYNNQPGRHYTPKQWFYMGLVCMCIVFAITFAFEFAVQRPGDIEGLTMLEIKIALCNTLYAIGFYLAISFACCNIDDFQTNAYRYLKIH